MEFNINGLTSLEYKMKTYSSQPIQKEINRKKKSCGINTRKALKARCQSTDLILESSCIYRHHELVSFG